MAKSANMFPTFYDRSQADQIFLPRYDLIAQEALRMRKDFGLKPAGQDQMRVALFGIDQQIGFCVPGASLFVPGAVEDSVRICDFIYRNLGQISSINFSLDTHRAYQIFHPTFWVDEQGNNPAAFTIITTADIKSGKWRPALYPLEAEAYVEALEKSGRYVLIIWPFHTMLGAVDHALVPIVFEAAFLHTLARQKQANFETKGVHPLTENYSVLEPEVKAITVGSKVIATGQFNANFFKMLTENDRIYVAGQASSHCVKETIKSLLDQMLKTDPDLVRKVYILRDCMSPVPAVKDGQGNLLSPDFPAIADAAIEEFRQAGMNVVLSTDPIA